MDRNSDMYLRHFRDMVLEGICCGLDHPVEWLVSYSRAIARPYTEHNEIDEFVDEASKELYAMVHCAPDSMVTDENVRKWMRDFYKNSDQTIKRA